MSVIKSLFCCSNRVSPEPKVKQLIPTQISETSGQRGEKLVIQIDPPEKISFFALEKKGAFGRYSIHPKGYFRILDLQEWRECILIDLNREEAAVCFTNCSTRHLPEDEKVQIVARKVWDSWVKEKIFL